MRRPANWNPNEIVDQIIGRATLYGDPLEGVKMHGSTDDLDRARIPGWVAELRDAEAGARRLRHELEALATDLGRQCVVCHGPVIGRAGRIYCSNRCRQQAHRARNV